MIFLAFRVADLAMVVYLGIHGQFTSGRAIGDPGAPPVVLFPPSPAHSLEYWDSLWYHRVAVDGYPTHLPRAGGRVVQNTWAFYPAFPALVGLLMKAGAPFVVAGVGVSLVAGGAAMCLLHKLLLETADRFTAVAGITALNASPAAAVFALPYTESLALLLVVVALRLIRSQRYGALLVVVLLLGLTRPIALPLALVIAGHAAIRWRRDGDGFPLRQRVRAAMVAAAAAASFLLWPLIAWVSTGEPDAFFATQKAWHHDFANVGWHSWLATIPDGSSVSVLVLLGLTGLVILALRARAWPLEGRLWTVAYGFYLAAATWPTASVWRFATLAIFPWWPLPGSGRRLGPRQQVAILVLLGVGGLAVHFVWVLRLWVPGPAWLNTGNP